MSHHKDTIIFYHGDGCPDGFGGAYAAWKKFGDTADYHPLSRSEEPPYELAQDTTVYFVDFSYPQEIMEKFLKTAKKLTVLDHHLGIRDVVEGMPAHVFDADRSGAGIAWDYFHEGAPRPALIDHVEDDDLYRFKLADTRAVITYLEVQPFDFAEWDRIVSALEDPTAREAMLVTARTYRAYFETLADISVDHAKLVAFEGLEILFANCHPLKSMKSYVGNLLVKKQGPCALVVSAHPNGYGVSIRGDGTVDVAAIARKFGGNGHPSSSGFLIPREGPFPWTLIEKTEE